MTTDPLADGYLDKKKDPFDANQALGTLLAIEHRDRLTIVVPGLRLSSHKWLGSIAYPLSGGFQTWSLLPRTLVVPILKLESAIDAVLGRFMAFRLLLVFEKTAT